MEVPIFLAADYANLEKGGKLNVLGIFNVIYSRNFPARHRTMFLVLRIAAQPGEYDVNHDMKILFLNEDGKELGVQWGTIFIPKPGRGTQGIGDWIIEVGDLHLPKPGRYEFRLIINKDSKGFIPLDVIKIDDSAEQQ